MSLLMSSLIRYARQQDSGHADGGQQVDVCLPTTPPSYRTASVQIVNMALYLDTCAVYGTAYPRCGYDTTYRGYMLLNLSPTPLSAGALQGARRLAASLLATE